MYSTIPDKFLYDGNFIAQKLPTSNLQNKEFHTCKYSRWLQTSPHFLVDYSEFQGKLMGRRLLTKTAAQ